MSIVDGTGLITWEGGLFEPGSDLLRRVQWAFGKIRAEGGTIILNESGRPYGVPGDQNVRDASHTASGRSTVYFQWGRYLRGETPSAANPANGPYASEHTQGLAIDCNAVDVYTMTLRAKYFAQAGLKNTISSESWHWAIRGNPLVDISSTTTASAGAISIPNGDEFDMASLEDLRNIVKQEVGTATASILSGIRREGRFRLFYCQNPPANLPHYIAIDRDADPGQNILYANDQSDGDGSSQARAWKEAYYMTDDTVEQAKANPVPADRFQKLVDFALRKDSAFTNKLAK